MFLYHLMGLQVHINFTTYYVCVHDHVIILMLEKLLYRILGSSIYMYGLLCICVLVVVRKRVLSVNVDPLLHLLALSFTIADALDKKQDECINLTGEVTVCLEAGANINIDEFCSSSCRSELTDYFNNCLDGAGIDQYNQVCGSAAIGVTLITLFSALLVAVIGN